MADVSRPPFVPFLPEKRAQELRAMSDPELAVAAAAAALTGQIGITDSGRAEVADAIKRLFGAGPELSPDQAGVLAHLGYRLLDYAARSQGAEVTTQFAVSIEGKA